MPNGVIQSPVDRDLRRNMLLNFRVENRTTSPNAAGSVEGLLYYDSNSAVKKLTYCVDGSIPTYVTVPRPDSTETVSGLWTFSRSGAPFAVSNSTVVTNLNADKVDGWNASVAVNNSTVAVRDTDGTLKASDPVDSDDLVTKGFAEQMFRDRDVKDPVVAATTGNVNLSSPGASIDGVTLGSNDRVLLKDQSTGSENGVWIFNGASSAMTRAADVNADSEVSAGLQVFVLGGTTHGGGEFTLQTADPITVGSTSLSFVQTGGQSIYSAGNGLVKSGNTFHFGQSSSYTAGALPYANGTSTIGFIQAAATGNVLKSAGTGQSPVYGKVDVTSDITGVIPVANGGTGSSTQQPSGRILITGGNGVCTTDTELTYDSSANKITSGSAQLNHIGLGVVPDTTYRLKTTGKSRLYNTTDFALLAETTGSNTAIFNATSAPPNYIVDFRLAGNSKVRIEPDGDLHAVEKIGIGITPSHRLHIKDDGDSGNGGLVIERSANTQKGYLNMRGGKFAFVTEAALPIRFFTNNQDRLSIESGGDVRITNRLGIGGLPTYDVHVQRANARIAADNGTVETLLQADSTIGYVGTNTNHKLILKTNNTSRLEIENDGDVKVISKLGVNTSPISLATATVNGTLQAKFGHFTGWSGNGDTGTGLGVDVGVSGGRGYVMAYNRTSSSYGDLRFVAAGGNTGLTLLSASGDVGCNTMSPSTKFHVYDSTSNATNAARTAVIDTLAVETHNTGTTPYNGFGQGIVFRGVTYNNTSTRTLGRIAHVIRDDSGATTTGTAFRFQTQDDPGTTDAPVTQMEVGTNVQITNKLGIGVTPSGQLHVRESNPGSFTYDTTADTLIVEGNGDAGITIATAAANTSRIIFASPNDPTGAEISYSNATNLLTVGITSANGQTRFLSGNGVEAMRIDSDGWLKIGTSQKDFARQSNFDYSTGSYKVLQLGTCGSQSGIAIGVDISSTTTSSFGGNEIIFPNQVEVISTNKDNNGFLGIWATDHTNKLRIGNYRWNILGDTPGITIDLSSSSNSGQVTLGNLPTSTADNSLIVESSGLLKKRTANSGIWTTNLGANRLLVSNSSGVITSDSNFIHLGGRVSLTGAIDSSANLKVDIVDHDVSSNDTNYEKAIYAYAGAGYNIASGVTDSGYRIAVDASTFVSDSDFQGTLNQQYAVWARHGAHTSASGSSITSSYGVYIDTLTNSNTSISNLWGLYQQSSAAKNYFAGQLSLGTLATSTADTNVIVESSGLLKKRATDSCAFDGAAKEIRFTGVHASATTDLDTAADGLYSNYGSHSYWSNTPTGMYGAVWSQTSSNFGFQLAFNIRHGNTDYGDLYLRTKNNSGFSDWRKIYHTGNLTLSSLSGVGGSGTVGKIPIWSGSTTTLGDSVITQNNGNVGIGTDVPSNQLTLYKPTGNHFPISLQANNIGTAGTYLGIQFGYTGGTYQKGAIIFESQDTSGRGKMHFALDNNANANNANIADSVMTLTPGGNVGISTVSPECKLDIHDHTSATTFIADNNAGVRITNWGGNTGWSLLGFGGFSSTYTKNLSQIGSLSTSSGTYLAFGTSNDYGTGITNQAMTIDPSGKVGIGVSSSLDGTLHIVGDASSESSIALYSSNVNANDSKIKFQQSNGWQFTAHSYTSANGYEAGFNYNRSDYGGDWYVGYNGGRKLTVSSVGNVGIGTDSPQTKLHLNGGPTSLPIIRLQRADTSVQPDDLIGGIENYSNDADGLFISSYIKGYATETYGRQGYLTFGTAGTNSTDASEKMRIAANGNVGINCTPNTNYKLDVNGDAARIGGNQTSTALLIEASDDSGTPAYTSIIKFKGYESRAQGIFFENSTYTGEEWFAGLQYGGAFNAYVIGWDQTGSQAEYDANYRLKITTGGSVYAQNSYYAGDGNTTYPSFSFRADTNTGMFRAGSDHLQFVTGGTSRLEITNAGHVIPSSLKLPSKTLLGSNSMVTGLFEFSNETNARLYFTRSTGNRARIAQVYETTIGDGSATSFTVNHNLGGAPAAVTMRDTSSGEYFEVDWSYTNANNITVSLQEVATSNEYTVTIVA